MSDFHSFNEGTDYVEVDKTYGDFCSAIAEELRHLSSAPIPPKIRGAVMTNFILKLKKGTDPTDVATEAAKFIYEQQASA
jgi:hypothetical protein